MTKKTVAVRNSDDSSEYLVEFVLAVPWDVTGLELAERESAKAAAGSNLADQGHLVRLWTVSSGTEGSDVIGLYRAKSRSELDDILGALPLTEWMRISVRALSLHPNDPASSLSRAW